VYHEPGEEGWGWPREEVGGADGGWVRGQYPEEDRAWAGRNLLPYETMTGSNYPPHIDYGWGGGNPGRLIYPFHFHLIIC